MASFWVRYQRVISFFAELVDDLDIERESNMDKDDPLTNMNLTVTHLLIDLKQDYLKSFLISLGQQPQFHSLKLELNPQEQGILSKIQC